MRDIEGAQAKKQISRLVREKLRRRLDIHSAIEGMKASRKRGAKIRVEEVPSSGGEGRGS